MDKSVEEKNCKSQTGQVQQQQLSLPVEVVNQIDLVKARVTCAQLAFSDLAQSVNAALSLMAVRLDALQRENAELKKLVPTGESGAVKE